MSTSTRAVSAPSPIIVISGWAKPLGIFSFRLKARYELASCSAIEYSRGFGGLAAAFFTIASILACRRLPSSCDSATAKLLEAHKIKRKTPHTLVLQILFITTGYDLMRSCTSELFGRGMQGLSG